MKKNVYVCCSEMFRALGRGLKYLDDVDASGKRIKGIYLEDGVGLPPLVCCPWCGEELPVSKEAE